MAEITTASLQADGFVVLEALLSDAQLGAAVRQWTTARR